MSIGLAQEGWADPVLAEDFPHLRRPVRAGVPVIHVEEALDLCLDALGRV